MSTSGTYSYAPSIGSLVLSAFARIQIRRSEVLTEHLQNAREECNLMQTTWANLGPLLWTVDLESVPLIQGVATYSTPPETVMILDAYVTDAQGGGVYTDRVISPLSRSEWASMPNKTMQGGVTSFWFDRLIAPTVTLWQVPDGVTDKFLKYYRFTQIQDANLGEQCGPQVPYLWLDAYVAGLAHRLARIYKPELEGAREQDAAKAYGAASMQGTENAPLRISPTTGSYWR